jgi:dihydrodipicolinate reductase
MPAMNTNNDVSVAIAGAAGRMGQRLCAMAVEMDGLTLGEAFDAPGHPALGHCRHARLRGERSPISSAGRWMC